MTATTEDLRIRNPFRDALVTELLEDVDLYRDMFSDNILIGEACSVFQPGNVVVTGPHGCGKSMILNLTRLAVLARLSVNQESWPKILGAVTPPFFGVSINLTRASFYTFGRRSVSAAMGSKEDPLLDTTAAADFLSHYLFHEFINGVLLLASRECETLNAWLGLPPDVLLDEPLPGRIANWPCWKGYYSQCCSWKSLKAKCLERLEIWRSFQNTDIHKVPDDIWHSNARPDETLHALGELVRSLSNARLPASLFVYIDQYEVLKELNKTHATELQRLINTLIKARDPMVFYKIGARTYDWGQELRVTGAESCIEVQRDYVTVNLTDVLVRTEDQAGYIYRRFAIDVACRRLRVLHGLDFSQQDFKMLFGKWNALEEALLYFPSKSNLAKTIQGLPEEVRNAIIRVCADVASPLHYRLASAWALQKLQRRWSVASISEALEKRPWLAGKWWFKERKEVALVQVASHANQKRRYYGWDTLCDLSGGNITAFLMLCSEIWDVAARQGVHPVNQAPLGPRIQSEGILKASAKWRERDRNEIRGGRRYNVINRIGMAINGSIRRDLALSNPGHTGFSLSESELYLGTGISNEVKRFLQDGVSWTVVEERRHKSKNDYDVTRRKYYLHPMLSPSYEIPIKRVKEPYYAKIQQVYSWIFGCRAVDFGSKKGATNT